MVIGLVFLPFFQAELDGKSVAFRSDGEGRIEADVPAGRHNLKLQYSDPMFHAGVHLAGFGLIPLASGFYILFGRKPKR